MKNSLQIKNLKAQVDGQQILHGVNLQIKPGKVVALMGPNGSGKSTLAHVLMGHPDYQVKAGQAIFNGKNILKQEPWQRARSGIFLAFQYPYEIPGLTVYQFLLNACQAVWPKFDRDVWEKDLIAVSQELDLAENFLDRGLNEGFSGGEKKRMEILQLRLLKPKIAILDETDSGLDIDALRLVAGNVKKIVSSQLGILVITHYQRLLNYLQPDEVHVMQKGRIVAKGDKNLAKDLEKKGYQLVQ